MVQDGSRPLDNSGRPLRSASPPAAWNAADLVWSFSYDRPGALRQFKLQCALQAATRRMFVHACEVDGSGEPLQDNIQVGVQGAVGSGRWLKRATQWTRTARSPRLCEQAPAGCSLMLLIGPPALPAADHGPAAGQLRAGR